MSIIRTIKNIGNRLVLPALFSLFLLGSASNAKAAVIINPAGESEPDRTWMYESVTYTSNNSSGSNAPSVSAASNLPQLNPITARTNPIISSTNNVSLENNVSGTNTMIVGKDGIQTTNCSNVVSGSNSSLNNIVRNTNTALSNQGFTGNSAGISNIVSGTNRLLTSAYSNNVSENNSTMASDFVTLTNALASTRYSNSFSGSNTSLISNNGRQSDRIYLGQKKETRDTPETNLKGIASTLTNNRPSTNKAYITCLVGGTNSGTGTKKTAASNNLISTVVNAKPDKSSGVSSIDSKAYICSEYNHDYSRETVLYALGAAAGILGGLIAGFGLYALFTMETARPAVARRRNQTQHVEQTKRYIIY